MRSARLVVSGGQEVPGQVRGRQAIAAGRAQRAGLGQGALRRREAVVRAGLSAPTVHV